MEKVVEELSDTAPSSEERLVEKETTLVNRSKVIVFAFVTMAAIATATFTYFFMENQDVIWYEDEFDEFVEEIFETGNTKYQQTDAAFHLLCDELTSFVTHSPDTAFPNVTLTNFDIKAGHVLNLVEAEIVAFAPRVEENEKEMWEAFALKEQHWIQESIAGSDSPITNPGSIRSTIYNLEDQVDSGNESPLYFPIWQIAPTPKIASESPIMLDIYSISWIREIIDHVLDKREAVMSPIDDLSFLLAYESVGFGHGHSDNTGGDAEERVLSLLVEPVAESFADDHNVVGVIVAVIDWVKFYSGILEDEAAGMIIDVQNTCGTSRHSFLVGDDITSYLGTGFVHDSKYKHMTKQSELGEELDDEEESSDRRRTRFLENSGDNEESEDDEEDEEECEFHISVHCSQAFVDYWTRDVSFAYAAVVLSIFVFTGVVFFVYDMMVERRQEKVLDTAEKTTAIVSSLFPKDVRDRMMQEQGKTDKRMGDFINRENDEKAVNDSAPIADCFEETTVCFADLVGFTKWSSGREPAQVFKLLETIYGEFDKIATRRKVFKVETIGDCYVAVCGLPEPNRSHHVIMARFARDCLTKMEVTTRSLVDELGENTASLQLRIGLHSGPVTAGVLRGRRARFQLFGDTVNTAARMESTGTPNKIQVSEYTASLLCKRGKSHWLTPRSDKVVAKGLGEMSTYWLEIHGELAMSTSSAQTGLTSDDWESDRGTNPTYRVQASPSRSGHQDDWNTSDVRKRLQHHLMGNRSSRHEDDPARVTTAP